MNAGQAGSPLRVFYRDYAAAVSISSAQPEVLARDRVAPLAERLLRDADNFVGVVDASDAILQCYRSDGRDRVTLELVYPEASGCLRLTLSREGALAILKNLPDNFDETLLQGGQYID